MANRPPISEAILRRLARKDAQKWGIKPDIFERQIDTESNFDADAVSPAGAIGDAQFMPATAAGLHVDPHDPVASLDAAAKLDASYVKKYGNYHDALVAYNAGPGAVGHSLPAETQAYIAKILQGVDPGGLSGSQSSGAAAAPSPTLGLTAPKLDKPAFEQAQRASIIGAFLAQRHGTNSPLFRTGLISTTAPDPSSFLTAPLPVVRANAVPATGQPGTSPITTPGSAPDNLRTLIERANTLDKRQYNYEWGGGHNPAGTPSHGVGHGSGSGIGFDCSGAVSKVLGIDPRVASQFEAFGQAGPGKKVSIYAKGTHVLMEINGHFFGTSGANPGGGAGWIPRGALSPGYLSGFVVRHPKGM